MRVEKIEPKVAAAVVIEHHYLHRRPTISHAFGLFDDHGKLQGVCTFGTPASRHLQMGVLPDEPDRVMELNRLWVSDEMPKNTESWFVSRCLKMLPALIVVSYADPVHGHYGYIYRALNFHYAGWTDMDRKTPRFDYIPLVEGAHTREAFRSGYKAKVRRVPKVRYWTVTGTPTDRKVLTARCKWAKMNWHETPPPEHRVI